MLREHSGWVALGAIVLVVILALGIAGWAGMRGRSVGGAHRGRRWGRRPHRNDFRPEGTVSDSPTRRAAIIVNPTKFDDVAAVRKRITEQSVNHGWAEPLFILTTERDPGTGQAKEALAKGVDLVCPLGGDGTVRAVAEAMVGSEIPMGLLPGGTGNLLARNLDLPVDDLDDALRVALTGQNKRVDVGRLTMDTSGEDESPAHHVFLVMAGLGFDAAIMADAPEGLKAKVGPAAYVVSGTRNLRGPQFKVRVKVEDQEEFSRRARTVVIGNCGKLLGGLVLMPEAEVDDGQLDMVILSPEGRRRLGRRRGPPRHQEAQGPPDRRPLHQPVDEDPVRPAAGGPDRRRHPRQGPGHLGRGRPRSHSSCGSGRSTDDHDDTASATTSRAARLARGAVAMVLFVVPVLLLGFAVRQKFDPLIRLDNDLIRRATDFTREHGTADALLALQRISQPFLLYVLASGLALWAWLARVCAAGRCGRSSR